MWPHCKPDAVKVATHIADMLCADVSLLRSLAGRC